MTANSDSFDGINITYLINQVIVFYGNALTEFKYFKPAADEISTELE